MESMYDFDSLQERHKRFLDVAKMEGNYMKIATRWCSFEKKKINNLWITAFLKQIFVRFLLILICTPTSCSRPYGFRFCHFQVLHMKSAKNYSQE